MSACSPVRPHRFVASEHVRACVSVLYLCVLCLCAYAYVRACVCVCSMGEAPHACTRGHFFVTAQRAAETATAPSKARALTIDANGQGSLVAGGRRAVACCGAYSVVESVQSDPRASS